MTTKIRAEIGRFAVEMDNEDCDYPWLVLDGDNDHLDCFATKQEAIEDAQAREDEAAAEDREGRLSDLRSQINEAIEDVDNEAKLAAILALIK